MASASRPASPSPAPTLVNTRAPSLASVEDKSNQPKSTSPASPSMAVSQLPLAPTSTGSAEKGAVAHAYAGSGSTADPFVVKFEEGDPTNPFNFSAAKRWFMVGIVAPATLCVAFGSSLYAGGIAPMEAYFGESDITLTAGLTVYVVGFALGPLLWAPLSEMYGRRSVFIYSYAPFCVFHIGCAVAMNIETLLVCRWWAGFFGSSVLTNSGALIGDCFPASSRALALSMFAMAPFMGPVLGPIVGGFIGENVSWRWLFWVEFIFSVVLFVAGLLFVPETYAPVLLRKRARKLSKQTGDKYVSVFDLNLSKTDTLVHKLSINLVRPFVLLYKELIVLLMAVYAAIVYGILYGFFAAFPLVFEVQRGWESGIAGLAFIGLGVGIMSGIFINVFVNKKYAADLAANNGKPLAPEARLPIMMLSGILLPVGMFWFAWTCQPSVHWIVCIIGSVPFGMGMVLCFLSQMNYLVDSYLMYAASALAANSVLRSMFGAVFPLFINAMFTKLGTNWALTVFAFLTLLCAPIPFLFYRYGAAIRARSSFAPGHMAPAPSKAPSIAEEVAEADLAQELRREDEKEAIENKA